MVLGFKDTKTEPPFIAKNVKPADVGTVLAAAITAQPALTLWDVKTDDAIGEAQS